MLKILLGKCVSKEWKNTRNPANKWVLKVTAETLEKVKKYVESLIKTLERNQWHRSGVFIVNVEHIPQLF